MPRPDLAVLYWFYKEPEVTKNHLQLLRKHNPAHKIYGLFGGNPDEAEQYQNSLGSLLDDFWTYPGTYGTETYTKWIHGDLLLLDWFDKRGRALQWESIAITQWDMLVFDDLLNQLPGLQPGQVYFSGLRDIDKALEGRWTWTKPGGQHREVYEDFRSYMKQIYGWQGPLKTCLYLFEVLTPAFFENYLRLSDKDKKLGMLEYKEPSLAIAWGIHLYDRDLGVYWQEWRGPEAAALIATSKHSVLDNYVRKELAKPDGWRIFHPNVSMW